MLIFIVCGSINYFYLNIFKNKILCSSKKSFFFFFQSFCIISLFINFNFSKNIKFRPVIFNCIVLCCYNLLFYYCNKSFSFFLLFLALFPVLTLLFLWKMLLELLLMTKVMDDNFFGIRHFTLSNISVLPKSQHQAKS